MTSEISLESLKIRDDLQKILDDVLEFDDVQRALVKRLYILSKESRHNISKHPYNRIMKACILAVSKSVGIQLFETFGSKYKCINCNKVFFLEEKAIDHGKKCETSKPILYQCKHCNEQTRNPETHQKFCKNIKVISDDLTADFTRRFYVEEKTTIETENKTGLYYEKGLAKLVFGVERDIFPMIGMSTKIELTGEVPMEACKIMVCRYIDKPSDDICTFFEQEIMERVPMEVFKEQLRKNKNTFLKHACNNASGRFPKLAGLFLYTCGLNGVEITRKAISDHLGVSEASTSKWRNVVSRLIGLLENGTIIKAICYRCRENLITRSSWNEGKSVSAECWKCGEFYPEIDLSPKKKKRKYNKVSIKPEKK